MDIDREVGSKKKNCCMCSRVKDQNETEVALGLSLALRGSQGLYCHIRYMFC